MAEGAQPSVVEGASQVQDEVCPYYHQAVELVGKRWTGAIVDALLLGPRRFSEISQAIPQISDRLLSMRLRELESEGIVLRDVAAALPVAVRYGLTPKGRELEPAVSALRDWARKWLQPERTIDSKFPAPLDDAANRRWDGVLGLAHAVKHGLRPASLPSSILAPPVARGFGTNRLAPE